MKIEKGKQNTIIISNIKNSSIYINLLKCNIITKYVIIEKDSNIIVDSILVIKRLLKNNIQKCSIRENNKPEKIVDYEYVLKWLSKYIVKDNLEIRVIFTEPKKLPLISIADKIKKSIIESCIYIDYVDGLYSIISKPENNLPNKFYYWEDTKTIFIFGGKEGPMFENNIDQTIEDLVCD